MLCDLYPIISTGGNWTAYANANGLTTLGVSGALLDQVPSAFDKYCSIYA